ncbi:hypothetical protein DQ04_02601000 [Trypanosoma grayi]|uniref:hypothetical protein n=1 Tax=Trypanosoma grayi TaxID=71804 RepID=UPI0004F49939|nr:hypothetical protein DQ04_02601000 [Trypanosoma grayi]KEG11453.1 hypothetical protein DQ04_02601000 [Trypanosoma grayi]
MEKRTLVDVRSIMLDQAQHSYSLLSAPLHIQMQYAVLETVADPKWAVEFEADIAYKCVSVSLIPSTACSAVATASDGSSFLRHTASDGATALQPGACYQLDVHLAELDLSMVEEKYLLQVGVLRLALLSGSTSVAAVNLVMQTKRNEQNELMRIIMSPLE